MCNDSILTSLDEVWSEVEILCATPGHHGNWMQREYKDRIFGAFSVVYRIQKLSGDELVALVKDRFVQQGDNQQEYRLQVLYSIRDAWDEWLYAWDRYSEQQT